MDGLIVFLIFALLAFSILHFFLLILYRGLVSLIRSFIRDILQE